MAFGFSVQPGLGFRVQVVLLGPIQSWCCRVECSLRFTTPPPPQVIQFNLSGPRLIQSLQHRPKIIIAAGFGFKLKGLWPCLGLLSQ